MQIVGRIFFTINDMHNIYDGEKFSQKTVNIFSVLDRNNVESSLSATWKIYVHFYIFMQGMEKGFKVYLKAADKKCFNIILRLS